MKKALSILLSLCIMFSVMLTVPTAASALDDHIYGSWQAYTNDDGTLTVIACRSLSEYSDHVLTIPSKLDGKTVTAVDWFDEDYGFFIFDEDYVKTLILPDTIKDVKHSGVFKRFRKLEKLVLPNNNDFDKFDALYLFSALSYSSYRTLKEIVCYNGAQLDGLERIGESFDKLEKLTITSDETFSYSLGNPYWNDGELIQFNTYPSLKTLTINAAKSISLSGRDCCDTLQNLDFSANKNLGEVIVSGFPGLTSLKLPASVRSLELSDCPLLNVSYPGDISQLSVEALKNCPNVNLPVIYINYYQGYSRTEDTYLNTMESAFANSKVREVHLDSRRISNGIEKRFFCGMPNLEKFVVHGDKSYYYTRDGVLYWGNMYYQTDTMRYANDLAVYPPAKSTTGTLMIPKDTVCIYTYALDGCKFSSITIPEDIHEQFFWDRCSKYNQEKGDWDTIRLNDVYPGKVRMVKYTSADIGCWFESSRIEYYLGSNHTISYNLNGGTNNKSNPTSYRSGQDITLKNPTKVGYKFLGWTRNDSDSATDYINTTEWTHKDLTFTAHWSKVLASPKITKFENTATGVKLTIGKVTGAAKYRIFIKSGGKWTKLADTAGTTFVHKAAKSGVKYTYSVRCLSKDGKSYTSSYNTTGWSTTFIAQPALPTLKNTKSGVQITLKKVTGAAKYRIFRKTGSGKWTKLIDTTSLKYVDKKAKKGVTYRYTVRCLTKNAKAYTSSFNTTGKAIKCNR